MASFGSFGEYLEALKDEQGVSWDAIARAAGVLPRQVYRWRNNEAQPGTPYVLRMMRFLSGDMTLAASLVEERGTNPDDEVNRLSDSDRRRMERTVTARRQAKRQGGRR